MSCLWKFLNQGFLKPNLFFSIYKLLNILEIKLFEFDGSVSGIQ